MIQAMKNTFFGVTLALAFAVALGSSASAQSTIKLENPALKQAQALIDQGKNDDAIALLTPEINKNPADGDVRLLRGEAYQNLGQFDKSLNDLDAAVVILSKSWNAPAARCFSRYMLRNYPGAIDDCTASLAIAKSGYAQRLLALANMNNGTLDAALAAANTYVTMDTGGKPLSVRCAVYYAMKNYDAAKTDCAAALAAPNPDYMAKNVSGQLAQEASDWATMEARYTDILTGAPTDPWAHYQRAVAYVNEKKLGLALSDLNTYVAAVPANGDGYYLRAQVEALQGVRGAAKNDAKAAIAAYQKDNNTDGAKNAQDLLNQISSAH